MKKSDKKIENAIREALSEACDSALDEHDGFVWLTHFVNFSNYPESLSIVCVFNTNEELSKADKQGFCKTIEAKLASKDIHFNDLPRRVSFDTEESCTADNNGKWHLRFKDK